MAGDDSFLAGRPVYHGLCSPLHGAKARAWASPTRDSIPTQESEETPTAAGLAASPGSPKRLVNALSLDWQCTCPRT
jgi:hypothetical protein